MASYHESVTPTTTETVQLRPYEYPVLPPIGRVLQAIRAHCGVGGTIQPGVRKLAEWAEYRSAGQIAPLLQQLCDDGWILYDPTSGCITLLAESEPISAADRAAISDADRSSEEGDSEAISTRDRAISETDRSVPISTPDRLVRRPSPILRAISRCDRSAPRMEDHVLATADQESDSVAVRSKLPCTADSITGADRLTSHPAAQIMAELGANPKVIEKALAVRPDWTPQQVRDRWDYDQRRIAISDGTLTEGIFFAALAAGHLAPPRRDLALNPAAYAGDPQFQPPSTDPIRDRAERLMPPMTALNNRTWMQDFQFLLSQLATGASDDQALDALATFQRRRGGP